MEPLCTGRCTCSHTAGTVAMASMTRSVKSVGYGLVNRSRRMPSTAPTARSRSAKSCVAVVIAVDRLAQAASPRVVPCAASAATSRTTSSSLRLRSGPRVYGTMQKVHL